jgi:hypothetical protein
VNELKITKKREQREKKAVETRDLALVARQLGVAYKFWTLLCGAINKPNKLDVLAQQDLCA